MILQHELRPGARRDAAEDAAYAPESVGMWCHGPRAEGTA